MRQSRIVCLSDYFGVGDSAKGGAGGAGVAALDTYRILRDLGAEAYLVAGFHAPAELADDPAVFHLGGEDLRERGRNALTTAGRAVWNAEARARVSDVLGRFDPDSTVMLLHQWTRYLSPAVLDLLGRYPTLVYMHDYFWFCPTGGYFDVSRNKPCELPPGGLRCATAACDRGGYAHKALRMARHAAKASVNGRRRAPQGFVHISQSARNLAEAMLPGEAHFTVYHPVRAEQARPAVSELREPPEFEVGYFGRLEPQKGLADLIEVLRDRPGRSLFVGTGEMADTIRQALPQAEAPGWVAQSDALALMRRCRTVILPSIWRETWGLVVPEALAQGVPVVVSRLAGSAELVERFGGGVVYDPAEPGALRAALARVLDSEPEYARLAAAAGRVVAAADLSPEAHGRRLAAAASEAFGVSLLP